MTPKLETASLNIILISVTMDKEQSNV